MESRRFEKLKAYRRAEEETMRISASATYSGESTGRIYLPFEISAEIKSSLTNSGGGAFTDCFLTEQAKKYKNNVKV